MNRKELRNFVTGMAFIGPNLLGVFIFILFPIVFSLVLSFSERDLQNGLGGLKFVGLEHFRNLTADIRFIESLRNNFVFVAFAVPLKIGLALMVALVLNNRVFFKNGLRAMYFIPYISNIVAVCAVWMMLFQPTYGPVNGWLMSLGVEHPPGWLNSSRWALPLIIVLHTWIFLGYNMVIYLAGLQNVPAELKEAARIDGAKDWSVFRYVTWPLLAPTTFFLLVINVIHSFKVFAPVNIMTDGGPGTSTTVLIYYIYISAFRFFELGYASAIAWVLFAIVFAVTYLQWLGQRKLDFI